MDGAKSVTDTTDLCKECGRQAFCLGESIFERRCEPCRNENPGGSRIIALLESVPLKGQGFLDNTN